MFVTSTLIAAWLMGAGVMHPPTAQPSEDQKALAPAAATYDGAAIAAPPTAEPLFQQEQCDLGAATSATDFTPAVACSRCPIEWPSCYNDKSCDSVCGGKGTGVCQWINSCSKCCTCAGTT